MSAWMNAFLIALAVLSYVVAPVVLISGWIRWVVLAKVKTLTSILSFIGFTSASVSGILAIATFLYAQLGATNIEGPLGRIHI